MRDLNFSTIEEANVSFDQLLKVGWLNRMDLQTAIEIFTPVFQLFLLDQNFWRTTNSLQLDETIALYVAAILQTPEHLVLHGLYMAMLYCLLMRMKQQNLVTGVNFNGQA